MITASNILHVVDIDSKQLSARTLRFFKDNPFLCYRDEAEHEHIYNYQNIDGGGYEPTPTVVAQLKQIWALCDENETVYFRITYL